LHLSHSKGPALDRVFVLCYNTYLNKKGEYMKTFLVQITREFEIEVEATDKAEALETALERFEDDATETITVDELAD